MKFTMTAVYSVGAGRWKELDDTAPSQRTLSITYKELVQSISCNHCGYTGSPTKYGGEKVGRPLHYLEGFPPGYKVINSKVDDRCPRCKKKYK